MNVTNLTKHALPALFELGKTPLIIGPHGAGKTSLIYQFAKENGYTAIPFRLGQMADAGDIRGLPEFIRDENGKAVATAFITPEDLTEAGENKCILFLDEINRCHTDLIQPVFQLIEKERKLGKFKLHEDSRVVAAANPPTGDYTVLDFREDKAFQSRFCHISFEPTTEEFFNYLKAQGRPKVYLDFLRENPQLIRGNVEEFTIDYMSPDNRAHDECAKFYEIALERRTPKEVIIEVMKGMVGREAAISFIKFADDYYSFVKGIEVLETFDKVKGKIDPKRVDAVHNTNDQIIEVLDDVNFTLKKKHLENLRQYIIMLGNETKIAFVNKVFSHKKLFSNRELSKKEFFNNDELVDHLSGIGMSRKAIQAKVAKEGE